MSKYIIGIDQSTQSTKALLFDEKGRILLRKNKAHRQLINSKGWISHDAEEIYDNTIQVIRDLISSSDADMKDIVAVSISNQRETSVLWDRITGRALADAVVWQCSRATEITERKVLTDNAQYIKEKTGIELSPFFPASKIAWLLENTPGAKDKALLNEVCYGTMDSYLVFRLTNGREYKTDYSNASRTQLFDIYTLEWDEKICSLFGIDVSNLPAVTASDAVFGYTDCEGFFDKAIPICGVMGDSHAALFGQNCRRAGETKATYGTGSSIMMNTGNKPVRSTHGVVSSLAWCCNGEVQYVLEGNLNYTGATVSWLKNDLQLINDDAETQVLALNALKNDSLFLVPAFSGLGAPYWKPHAKAAVIGMDRTTGKNEFVRAALESIAYQIADVVFAMAEDSKTDLRLLKADGGPTSNSYLMQFQSDILNECVIASETEELSAAGAAYMCGMSLSLYDETVFDNIKHMAYDPQMDSKVRENKLKGWKNAVEFVVR